MRNGLPESRPQLCGRRSLVHCILHARRHHQQETLYSCASCPFGCLSPPPAARCLFIVFLARLLRMLLQLLLFYLCRFDPH